MIKVKVAACCILAVVPELMLVLESQSVGELVINAAVGCCYFLPGLPLPSQLQNISILCPASSGHYSRQHLNCAEYVKDTISELFCAVSCISISEDDAWHLMLYASQFLTLNANCCQPCKCIVCRGPGARVFRQPLDSRCPAAEQQTMLCASGCPTYSAYLIGAKLENKM